MSDEPVTARTFQRAHPGAGRAVRRPEEEAQPARGAGPHVEPAPRVHRSAAPGQPRGPRADRPHGRRGLPARAAPQPLRRILRRVRVASGVSARRRPAAPELEAVRPQRQALHQAVRRRDQPRLPPGGRPEHLDGDQHRGGLEAALCDDAGGGGRPPRPDAARCGRGHALRRSGARPRQAEGQGQPARRDPGGDGAMPRPDAGRVGRRAAPGRRAHAPARAGGAGQRPLLRDR